MTDSISFLRVMGVAPTLQHSYRCDGDLSRRTNSFRCWALGHLLLPPLKKTVVQRKQHQYCLEAGEADLYGLPQKHQIRNCAGGGELGVGEVVSKLSFKNCVADSGSSPSIAKHMAKWI